MHLKLDGHALLSGLMPLRALRKLPRATISACPHTLGKIAQLRCGVLDVAVPVLDRRAWSDTVEFDGAILKALARLPVDDMFMDVCRVEYIAGRIVFMENVSTPATILA